MNLISRIENYKGTFTNMLNNALTTRNRSSVPFDKWAGDVIDILIRAKNKKRKLFLIGNGASCSMASHLAVDFTKNGGIDSFSINEGTLLTCYSNDFSFGAAYREILKSKMNNNDILIAISSSGRSENILNAVDFVRKNYKNSAVITFSGFKNNNPLSRKGNYNLYLNVNNFGLVESGHAYYLHLLLDLFVEVCKK